MAAACALDELWHPASATALERALHPAGHGPNSSSLLRPQAAVVAVAYLAENYFLFVKLENLRIFQLYFFTGRGRSGKRHIACAGSLRGNEPSQALRASSPEGRAKGVTGVLLASPFGRGGCDHREQTERAPPLPCGSIRAAGPHAPQRTSFCKAKHHLRQQTSCRRHIIYLQIPSKALYYL